MILVVFINIEDKDHAHKKHKVAQIMFSSFLYAICFLNVVIFFCDLHRVTLLSFVIFDKIEGWLKGNFERDCKCETKLWGIAILNVSWKALKMVIIHNEFNCKAVYFICEPCRAPTSLIDKTSAPIIPFSKLLGIDIVSSFKIANFIWIVLFEVYKCWNIYTRGFWWSWRHHFKCHKDCKGWRSHRGQRLCNC